MTTRPTGAPGPADQADQRGADGRAARSGAAGRGLRRRWILQVTAGEFVGFAAPAVVGAVTASAVPAVQVPALVAAGAIEGAVLGAAQAGVLRRVLPGLPVARFVTATSAAAAAAYVIAMVPVVLGERLTALPWPLLVALAAVLGSALLASLGTAQWLVLRRLRPATGFWVPVTAAAWAVGLLVFLAVATPLWQEGQPLALTVAIGILGGLAMAVTVALVTAPAALRLARSDQ